MKNYKPNRTVNHLLAERQVGAAEFIASALGAGWAIEDRHIAALVSGPVPPDLALAMAGCV